MASLGALYSAARSVRCHATVFPPQSTSARPCSLSIANFNAKSQPLKAAITISSGESRAVSREKLDEWMRDSVVEIVKNLREAPLLVQVFRESGGAAAEVELRMQRAVAEADWKAARAGWEEGKAPMPEGVIFVEELQNDDVDGVDRVWGIAVQGRGSECGGPAPACYLLKTTRVGSGLGFCCTHFCLMKVTSFREKAKTQFNKCWLVSAGPPMT